MKKLYRIVLLLIVLIFLSTYNPNKFDLTKEKNNSFFKIYYYGNPKKLSSELLKFGYKLKNNQGHWTLDTY